MRSTLQTFQQTLSSWGLGGRVQKTTIAVMLAWIIGMQLSGELAHPYFAPLAALLASQGTIAESISTAMQRVLGIVAGVILALIVTLWLGQTVWGVGLIVFLSLFCGYHLRLTPPGTSQVAVSALIVMCMGNASSVSFGIIRVVESTMGALVGVGINALIAPPHYVPSAQNSIRTLAQQLRAQLENLASNLQQTPLDQAQLQASVRGLREPFSKSQAALGKAKTSLKYNLRGSSQQQQIKQLEQSFAALETCVTEAATIARNLCEHNAQAALLNPDYAQIIQALAGQVQALEEQQNELQARQQFISSRIQLEEKVQSLPNITPATWVFVGAAIASAERMSKDLLLTLQARI
jgi:uncharacterized membrane protein YgaE (UPF0421/DUF939 family)